LGWFSLDPQPGRCFSAHRAMCSSAGSSAPARVGERARDQDRSAKCLINAYFLIVDDIRRWIVIAI
jgi:hypothetical protein